MVKKIFISLILIQLTVSVAGCGVWNEKPPARKIVYLESAPMPAFTLVFEGTNDQSLEVLDKWKSNTLNTFNQVKGKTPDYLSEDEIGILIKAKLFTLGDTQELSIARAHSLIKLLGFKDGISKRDVEHLFTWVEENRERLRTFYQLFISERLMTAVAAKSVSHSIELLGSLFTLGGDESITEDEVIKLLKPWIPPTMVYFNKSVGTGVPTIISLFSSLCGDRVDAKVWNGKKVGMCLMSMAEHFAPISPAVDFLVGNVNPVKQHDVLVASNDQLVSLMKSWMKGHHHPPFVLKQISDFAADLEIPRPYNFFKLTEWLPKLNPKNTTKTFHPDFMIDIAGIVQNWIATVTKVTEGQTCDNPKWQSCTYTGKYEILDAIYNDEYASLVRTKNFNTVSRLALFDALVKMVFNALDTEKEGVLGVQIKDLITVAIRAADSHSFIDNVIRRLSEKQVYISNVEDDLSNIQKAGLSEVAAMAAEILPRRDSDGYRSLWERLSSNFTSADKRIPYTIDALGLTTLLYIYDLMGDLRLDYLSRYKFPVKVESPNDSYVDRRLVVQTLPTILYDHFPRLYNACIEWGFERTCGIVFTQLLSNPDPGRIDIQPYQTDMVNLGAIFAESMMSRCDRDHDDYIRNDVTDGNDEKTCILTIIQAMVNRLMEAGILEKDPKMQKILNLVTGNPLFKHIGKAAIGRGTMDGIALQALPPFSFIQRAASLGSILSLTAEMMDSDKADAVKSGVFGPTKGMGPGDEYIYLDQFTAHYLPTTGKAKRTTTETMNAF